jgi:hypothetical protein
VNKNGAGQIIRQTVAAIALLSCTLPALAGNETMTAMAPPHGPILMFYVSQPLWSPGASRIYGLRLDQISVQRSLQASTFSAIAPPRSLIDLQFRRNADIRVEFGRRVTFDMRRKEFNLSGYQHGMSADLIGTTR